MKNSDKRFNNNLNKLDKVLKNYDVDILPSFYDKLKNYFKNEHTHDDKLYITLIVIYSAILPDDVTVSSDTFECLFDKFNRKKFIKTLMEIPPFISEFTEQYFIKDE